MFGRKNAHDRLDLLIKGIRNQPAAEERLKQHREFYPGEPITFDVENNIFYCWGHWRLTFADMIEKIRIAKAAAYDKLKEEGSINLNKGEANT